MAAHHPHQLLHQSEHALASLLAPGSPRLLRHGDTESIHLPQELLRGLHAPAQASLADQPRRFHQRAHSIPQQHPVGRKVDVRLEAGAIQKILLQVQGFLEAQLAGLVHRTFEQSVNHLTHLPGVKPVSKALDLALGGHAHLVQRIDQAEPLIERVAGQLATEPAIVFLQEGPQHRAPEGSPGTLLKLLLFLRRGLPLGRTLPAGQSALHKVALGAALAQKSVDLLQALA